jgi:hypothetical protein
MASYVWSITKLWIKPQEDGYTDVVVTAIWECNGSEGQYTGYAHGDCSFVLQSGEGFTPFDQLTEQQVLSWCWSNGIDKSAVELSVNDQIQNKINPPVVAPKLPWE